MTFLLATTPELLQLLGARIRAHRLSQGLPQRELAQMAGLSLGALRQLESTGQSSLDTWVRTLQALGLAGELEELLVHRPRSIADMEQADATAHRQRAPRRSSP